MKKRVIVVLSIVFLLTLAIPVLGGDTKCLESIENIGIAHAECFGDKYLAPVSASNCRGVLGGVVVTQAGTINDINDASAVGAQCPLGCFDDEQGGDCTAANGQIIVDMGAATPIKTLGGTTTDFYVNEGGALERFRVYVGTTPSGPWTDLGYSCAGGGGPKKTFQTVGGENFYEFNIPGGANLSYRYVKINVTAYDAAHRCDDNTVNEPQYRGSDIGWVLAARVPCTDECTPGAPFCLDTDTIRQCVADPQGTYDGDTCADWRDTSCTGNDICSNATSTCVPPTGSCTPATCQSLGKQCGTWSNGTCAGNVICGNNGECSQPGNYCNITGQCNPIPITVTGEGLSCTEASGNLISTNNTITTSINLNVYEIPNTLIGQGSSQPLSSGGAFNVTYNKTYNDNTSHTFSLRATNLPQADPVVDPEVEIQSKTLVCGGSGGGECEIKTVYWEQTCIGAGNAVNLTVKADTTCSTTTNNINFTVYEDDSNNDDPAQKQPAQKKISAGSDSAKSTWTAEWQQDQFTQNPRYYINATLDGKTVTSMNAATGKTLEVRYCNKELDSDCDGVRNERDSCQGTPQCATVNSRGCTGSSTEGQCAALWDCSTVNWTSCADGKITRSICQDESAGSCCTTWAGSPTSGQPTNCQCIFLGNLTDFNLCTSSFTLDNERTCIIEEPFPVFTWINILGVLILLGLFYTLRRKA